LGDVPQSRGLDSGDKPGGERPTEEQDEHENRNNTNEAMMGAHFPSWRRMVQRKASAAVDEVGSR
jgi:hypothetical protein